MPDSSPVKSNGSSVDQQREKKIHLRVSAPEKRKFEKLAKNRHTNLSEIVRQLLHKEADSSASRQGA